MAVGWGLGAMEMLILIAMGGGMGGDLVSFLPADVYFKSRNIPITAESLIDVAGRDPKDAKTQIAQLLALRTLGEQPELVKNAKNKDEILKALHKIARGETAKDKQGFAPEYAARTLLALGQTVELPMTGRAARDDALAWFPDSATLVGALAPQRDGQLRGTAPGREMRQMLTKMMPPQAWDEVFKAVDQVGNVRVERIAFALADDAKEGGFFVRLTGRGDPKRLVDAIRGFSRNQDVRIAESQDAKGTPIVTVTELKDGKPHDRTPALALIGETDCVIAGFMSGKSGENRDPQELIARVLNVRAGKAESVFKGKLQSSLAKVSDKAVGLLVGELPAEMRKGIGEGGVPMPRSVRAEIGGGRDGLDVRFHGEMDSADDAKMFVKMMLEGQKKALEGIQKVPAEVPVPPATITAMKRAIESFQVRVNGKDVEGGVFVPAEALQSMPAWMFFGLSARGPVPPPAQALPGKQARAGSRAALAG